MTNYINLLILFMFLISTHFEKQVAGTYRCEKKYSSIEIKLNSDLTFSLDFNSEPSGYSTCGTFRTIGDTLYLKDFQDSEYILNEIDCATKKVVPIRTTAEMPIRRNNWTIFDKKRSLMLIIKKSKTLYLPSKKMFLTKK